MTTDERISKLENCIENLRLATDVVFTESARKRIFEDVISAGIKDNTLTDLNTTTNIAATPSSVTHASPYDFRLRVIIDGVPYYIGLYSA